METVKSIGDWTADDSPWLKFMKSMSPEKRRIIMQIAAPWGCWDMARGAYETASDRSETIPEDTRIMKVGAYAFASLAAFRRCMELLGKSKDDTLRTMDETSAWMKRNGWNGLPEPTNRIGMTIRKTAADMYADMERFAAARREYLVRTELQKGERR